MAAAVPAAVTKDGASPAESLWPHPEDPIFRLWNAPAAHPIRWLVFFFPLAWLAGHGALRAAIGLALVFVAGDLASRLLTIAYASGFGELSHFNHAFRRRYGATPSEVRREQAP